MGVVYEALNRLTGERVALKTILPQHVANPKAAERFVREIQAARCLRHPGIVAIHDVGQDGDLVFFTMEHIEGQSLRSVLNERGRLKLGETVNILSQLCNTLEYAHQYLIHRDLSPENVMLLGDGSVKLLDFGLARQMDVTSITASGIALGKAFYMAPEQAKGAADVDARADIYSLGVMFFQMLAGKLPMGMTTLRDVRPDLPEACDQLLARVLVPAYVRLSTVREFRGALRVISMGEEVSRQTAARPPDDDTDADAPNRPKEAEQEALSISVRHAQPSQGSFWTFHSPIGSWLLGFFRRHWMLITPVLVLSAVIAFLTTDRSKVGFCVSEFVLHGNIPPGWFLEPISSVPLFVELALVIVMIIASGTMLVMRGGRAMTRRFGGFSPSPQAAQGGESPPRMRPCGAARIAHYVVATMQRFRARMPWLKSASRPAGLVLAGVCIGVGMLHFMRSAPTPEQPVGTWRDGASEIIFWPTGTFRMNVGTWNTAGTYSVDLSTRPRRVRLENTDIGIPFTGIYEIDDEQLRLALRPGLEPGLTGIAEAALTDWDQPVGLVFTGTRGADSPLPQDAQAPAIDGAQETSTSAEAPRELVGSWKGDEGRFLPTNMDNPDWTASFERFGDFWIRGPSEYYEGTYRTDASVIPHHLFLTITKLEMGGGALPLPADGMPCAGIYEFRGNNVRFAVFSPGTQTPPTDFDASGARDFTGVLEPE